MNVSAHTGHMSLGPSTRSSASISSPICIVVGIGNATGLRLLAISVAAQVDGRIALRIGLALLGCRIVFKAPGAADHLVAAHAAVPRAQNRGLAAPFYHGKSSPGCDVEFKPPFSSEPLNVSGSTVPLDRLGGPSEAPTEPFRFTLSIERAVERLLDAVRCQIAALRPVGVPSPFTRSNRPW